MRQTVRRFGYSDEATLSPMCSGRPVVSLVVAAVLGVWIATPAARGQAAQPDQSDQSDRTEAFVVLRGFGYGGDGKRALEAIEPAINAAGMDLFVPDYLSRSGLDASRRKLQRFFADSKMAQYQRLHVFAFLAGSWTFNRLVVAGGVPKLATVIADRSPYQERAPRIADDDLHFLAWIRYGSTVFDVARTPYPRIIGSNVRIGLVVETQPTSFIRDHQEAARSYGPFRFECESFEQRHDDCMFVDLNHDELYARVAEVWPDVLSFVRTGRFTDAANRKPPTVDALATPNKR